MSQSNQVEDKTADQSGSHPQNPPTLQKKDKTADQSRSHPQILPALQKKDKTADQSRIHPQNPPALQKKSASSQADLHNFIQQFIPDYAKSMDVHKYMKFAKFMNAHKAPTKASDCRTKKELDAWLKMKEAPVKEFIPNMWQGSITPTLKKEY